MTASCSSVPQRGELRLFDELVRQQRGGVVFVHGPSGIGKSALAHEYARRGRCAGCIVHVVDGRLLDASATALLAACRPATAAGPRAVLVIDSFDRVAGQACVLRDGVLRSLPASAVVVLLGRRPPGPLWSSHGWEHLLHEVALGRPVGHGPGEVAAVREALRRFHDPVRLAVGPLASGTGVDARAESVRQRLRAAVDVAFGSSPPERQLRRLVERGYLDSDGGHRAAMAQEHLSRSAYFRHLADAVERLAVVVRDDGQQHESTD